MLLQLYPFVDLAKNAAAPLFPLSVDIVGKLDAIAEDASITTEFAFHSAISAAFDTLNDGHSSYSSDCFSGLVAMLPFAFGSLSSGSATQIYVAGAFTQTTAWFDGEEDSPLAAALDKTWSTGLGGKLPSAFKGYIVETIDGVDAVTAIKAFSDSIVGQSKSPEARFNRAVVGYKWKRSNFIPSTGLFYFRTDLNPDFPDSVVVSLVSPSGERVKVKANWLISVEKAVKRFVSTDAYYKANCVPSASKTKSSANAVGRGFWSDAKAAEPIAEPIAPPEVLSKAHGISSLSDVIPADMLPSYGKREAHVDLTPSKVSSRSAAYFRSLFGFSVHPSKLDNPFQPPPTYAELESIVAKKLMLDLPLKQAERSATAAVTRLQGDENGAFFVLNNKTAVWVLKTFDSANDTNAGISRFHESIVKGLVSLEAAGTTRLIIDVTNNGGGSICLGQAVIRYLFAAETVTPVMYDVRATSMLSDLITMNAKSGADELVFDFSENLDRNGKLAYPTASALFTPGLVLDRGGTQQKFSNKFLIDCRPLSNKLVNASIVLQLKRGWAPENIAIASNGFCGSTCAIFTRTMRESLGIKSYTYGGPTPSKPFQPTSFEGGRVARFHDVIASIRNVLAASNVTTPSALAKYPYEFPLPANGGIAFWEAYSQVRNASSSVAAAPPLEFSPWPADAALPEIAGATQFDSVWAAVEKRLMAGK
ncbi:hypothetical protein DFJ73DRAFT_843484 [Zopfochytrium polystomum]|nr:hypothetical protein DFJ73DRAFT_843484 [Zopfochytrium polystomum]